VFRRHIQRCCPDLLERTESDERTFSDDKALEFWLGKARKVEENLHQEAVRLPEFLPISPTQNLPIVSLELVSVLQLSIAFRQKNADGDHIRQGAEEIGAALNITIDRAERLLKNAMKAVPLAADFDPIEILYEDEYIVALNKPPHLITAPKHRFTGGSLVNRVIGNLGLEPLVIHRLDMNTTGVVLFAKKRPTASELHAQFRNKTPRKRYLALSIGIPEWRTTTVEAPIGHSTIEKYATPDSSLIFFQQKIFSTRKLG